MAARKSTAKARPNRNSAFSTAQTSSRRSAAPDPDDSAAEALEDFIEDERLRLMKAHSILICVRVSMEEGDLLDNCGPYYPAIIELASELVNETIRRLDSIHLKPFLPRQQPLTPAR